MKYLSFLILVFLMFVSLSKLASQANNSTSPKAAFDPFKGLVYEMPLVERKVGKYRTKRILERYSERVQEYPVLDSIELKEINVPETTIGQGVFPGVERSIMFCMILNSKMYIEYEGCYEFSLDSDDGSILWINGREALNNDGGHQMQMSKDTVGLTVGEYDVRLWYFQGMPDRFGIQMDNKLLPRTVSCDSISEGKLDLNASVFFETGQFALKANAAAELEKLFASIDPRSIASIEVTGHTDSQGSKESNQILSEKRAETIANELNKLFFDHKVEIIHQGKGESQPKADNATVKGRELNRRVELLIGYK